MRTVNASSLYSSQADMSVPLNPKQKPLLDAFLLKSIYQRLGLRFAWHALWSLLRHVPLRSGFSQDHSIHISTSVPSAPARSKLSLNFRNGTSHNLSRQGQ